MEITYRFVSTRLISELSPGKLLQLETRIGRDFKRFHNFFEKLFFKFSIFNQIISLVMIHVINTCDMHTIKGVLVMHFGHKYGFIGQILSTPI